MHKAVATSVACSGSFRPRSILFPDEHYIKALFFSCQWAIPNIFPQHRLLQYLAGWLQGEGFWGAVFIAKKVDQNYSFDKSLSQFVGRRLFFRFTCIYFIFHTQTAHSTRLCHSGVLCSHMCPDKENSVLSKKKHSIEIVAAAANQVFSQWPNLWN